MKKIIILAISLLFFCINNLTFWDNVKNIKLDSTYNLIYTKLESKSNWNKNKLLVYLKLLDEKLQNYNTEDFKYIKTLNSNKIVWLTNSSNNNKLLNVTYNDNSITLYSKSICSSNYKNEHIEIFNWNWKIYATKNFSYDIKWCLLTIPDKNIIEWKIWNLNNENYIFWDLYSKTYEKKKFSDFNIEIKQLNSDEISFSWNIIWNWKLSFYNDFDNNWKEKYDKWWNKKEITRDEFVMPLEYLWSSLLNKNYDNNRIYWIIDDREVNDILVSWDIKTQNNTTSLNWFLLSREFKNTLFTSDKNNFSIILSYNGTFIEQNLSKNNLNLKINLFWDKTIPWIYWFDNTTNDIKIISDNKELNLDILNTVSWNWKTPWMFLLPKSVEDLKNIVWKKTNIVVYNKSWKELWKTEFIFNDINPNILNTYEDIQKLTLNLTKDATSKEDKIKIVINWIVDNMNYNNDVKIAFFEWNDDEVQKLKKLYNFSWWNFYKTKDWICTSFSELAGVMLYSIWIDSYIVYNNLNGNWHAIIAYEDDWNLWYVEPQRYFKKETESSLKKYWYEIISKTKISYSFYLDLLSSSK